MITLYTFVALIGTLTTLLHGFVEEENIDIIGKRIAISILWPLAIVYLFIRGIRMLIKEYTL